MTRTIPIIELYGNLIVSVQVELSDRLVLELKENIADEVCRRDVHGLIIEVSGIDVFDSFIARSVRDLAQIVRLMGVRTILAGLAAGMASTLVEMGMTMSGVETALTLEHALAMLASSSSDEPTKDDAEVNDEVKDEELLEYMLGQVEPGGKPIT